ncbi:MAG: glycoside hydrolase family 97 catalytic domain-containing protein [Bacteroidetes bacterium]|nr:glycoside hydrolase family 97 catalytic domain-containing protein [Bacteroidota bacterium]
MKHLLQTGLLLLFACRLIAQQPFTLYSPDSSLRLEINTQQQLSYKLFAHTIILLQSPSIDVELGNGTRLSDQLTVVQYKYNRYDQPLTVPVPSRRKMIRERYNHLGLVFPNNWMVIFRMYNEGMAYRIVNLRADSVIVNQETALFETDPGSVIWYAHIDKRPDMDRFHTSFEGQYRKDTLAKLPDTLFTYAPVTVSLPNGYQLAISDAGLHNYPGMFLQKNTKGLKGVFAPYPQEERMTTGEFPQRVVTQRAPYIARAAGYQSFPWRAIMVAKNDIGLPDNDLFYLLGEPTTLKDVSWIKPGKGTDEWITGINLFNVPFEAGINTATYKYYIDFAKRFGFTQIMLDAGWSDYKDLFKINPALNMNELVAYAKSKGIKLMLWTLCSTLDQQLEPALSQFNAWGVESIMTDFMDRDDQPMVNFYHRIAKACADHRIQIMFHGAYPPKGFNRTWPNAITQEGVLGSEWNIWSELPTPEHNVTLAWTRMLAGPMDYEPGLLLNAQKDQFRPIGKNPMSMGTRCHQLAMFVVYDSPLQIFSGNISQGMKEPAFMELLGGLPTTWDETKILQGKIGEYIITARKKGKDWYVAGLNNNTQRVVTIPLNFAERGLYKITQCVDGINAHNYGSDYILSTREESLKETISITMKPGGGFLLQLKAF